MASLIRYDPFKEMQLLQKQLFDDDWFTSAASTLQLPTTDVYTENGNRMVVEAHLPQFDESDVSIAVDDGALEIQAQKHEREEDKKRRYVVHESSSSFYRRIRLPEQADTSKIEAGMEHGMLRVVVPFKEQPASKKVTIKLPKKLDGQSKATKQTKS